MSDVIVKESPSYDLVDWKGDLPAAPKRAGGAGRPSQVMANLAVIEADPTRHGEWKIVVHYPTNGQASPASAQKTNLRKRFGDSAACKGWEFEVRRGDVQGHPRVALFARFNPAAIEKGAFQNYVKVAEAKAKERAAKKAAGETPTPS